MKTKNSIKILMVILVIALSIVGWFLYNNSGARLIKHVVLISMDTTRADALSCYENQYKTTANIDALAAEGVLFENAIAPVPLTLPSHSTMLTGTTPLYHGVHDNTEYRLDESYVTLAEILKNKGFSTGAFVGSFMLDSQFGLDQGFDHYDDDLGFERSEIGINERIGGETSRLACEWIDDHYMEKMFLFLHFYDPHMDYNPPAPYDSMFTGSSWGMPPVFKKFGLYMGEIAYTDHCIGQVIDKLKSLGIYDSTLIVVTADHGEMLSEHKEITHGYFVYRSNIRVPLVFKLPGRSRPVRIKNLVGLVDIVPAICSLLDIELSWHVQGKDISPYLLQNDPVNLQRHVYSESLTPTMYKCNTLLALVSDRYKYIQTTRPELYDLIEDPKETNNLIDQDPNLVAQSPESKRARLLQGHLQQIIEQTVKPDGSDNITEFDEETIARLEGLGYVSGGITEDFSFDQSMSDPKDLIVYHTLNTRIKPRLMDEEYDQAREFSEKMISLRPNLYQGHLNLGLVALAEKDYAAAITSLNKSAECDRDQYLVHRNLSVALYEQKQYDQGLLHLQEALRLRPGFLQGINDLTRHAWVRATSADDKHYDPPKALELVQKAMELIPPETKKGAGLLRTLAAAQAGNGNFSEAVETARQAVQLAMSQGNKQLALNIQKEMKLYRNNTPYRESTPPIY